MKIFKTLSKRGLALFLALMMCMSLLPANALAMELAETTHTCNEDGWTCVKTDVLTCKEEHEHTDVCYEWTHTQPSAEVSIFLRAVKELPAKVTAEDADLIAKVRSAYDALNLDEQTNPSVVEALKDLVKAEDTLKAIAAARAAEAEEAAKLEEAVKAFTDAVDALPEEITAEDEAAVTEARNAYDALPEAGKADERVAAAYGKLENAEAALKEIEDAKVAEAEAAAKLEEAVQAFLAAVNVIPEITAENAVEVSEYLYGECADLYEILLGTEAEELPEVQAAAETMAAAMFLADEMLGLQSETLEMKDGGTYTYKVGESFKWPANSTNQWTSDESVVNLYSKKGSFSCVGEGTATISWNSSNGTATQCTINVSGTTGETQQGYVRVYIYAKITDANLDVPGMDKTPDGWYTVGCVDVQCDQWKQVTEADAIAAAKSANLCLYSGNSGFRFDLNNSAVIWELKAPTNAADDYFGETDEGTDQTWHLDVILPVFTSYTVHHVEDGTTTKVHEDTGGMFGDENTVTVYPLNIPGYTATETSKTVSNFSSDTKEATFYYTKRTDLSYTVNYLEQGTNKVLHGAKTVNDQTFQAEVTEDAIDIAGYNKVNPTSKTITIQVSGNEINFYYVEKDVYTVMYDLNAGTSATTPESYADLADVKWTQASLLPGAAPTRDGYIFSGWYTSQEDASATTVEPTAEELAKAVAAETAYSELASGNDRVLFVQLYAGWTLIPKARATFDLMYDPDPSDGSDRIWKTQYGDAPLTVTDPGTPLRSGYTFDGWYTEETGGEKADFSKEVTITSDKVYYARWSINSYAYTIEYYYDGEQDEDATETMEAEFKTKISGYIDKSGTNYELDHAEGLPLTISANEIENVIKVYYVERTESKSYQVEYYRDGVKQGDAETVIVENVLVTTTELTVDSSKINTIDKFGTDYVFDYVDTEGNTIIPTKVAVDGTVKVYYAIDTAVDREKGTEPDETGDGIPDKYQITVNFAAVNGTVSFNSAVVTKRDANGDPSEDGTARLAPQHIPATAANEGFGNGTWNREPVAGTVVTNGETLTITYTATTIPTPDPDPDPNPVFPTPIPDTPTPLDPGTDIPDEDVPLANAVGLNDVDHFAYVIGYDDDTVRPLNNITRAEAVTIFFRLMTDEYRAANWSTENTFSDVNAGNWFNNAVSTVQKAGALEHFAQDEKFLPNQAITRAEFASIAAGFVSDEITGENVGDFSDTEGHWAAEAIRKAVEAGWINGVGGNRFAPDQTITRAEVMAMINRMLDRIPDADHMLPDMKKWTDNPEDAWYYADVQEATNEHDYERDEMSVENWTLIKEHRDWAALETKWAANGGTTAPVDPAQPAEGETEGTETGTETETEA